MTAKDAAKACNAHFTTINNWLRAAGKAPIVNAYRSKRIKALLAKYERLVARGVRARDAAALCGVTHTTIYRWRRQVKGARRKRAESR